jgi:hypothetical protein
MGTGRRVGRSQADLCAPTEDEVVDAAAGAADALAVSWGAVTGQAHRAPLQLVLAKAGKKKKKKTDK